MIEKRTTESIILQQVDPADLELAMLKVCGLDKCSKEMQLIALKMANQYGFKLELKHVVPIQGALYITRDGLLHIAHKSGQLDGMEIIDQGGDKGSGWWCKFAVYRKDMSHPFVYVGRYNGSNRKYGPEMAVKCAESMALRRAFDVGLCSREERFDLEEPAPSSSTPTPTRPARPTLPAPEPAKPVESKHKDNVLKSLEKHNVPLKFMNAVSQLYGEEDWGTWSPDEEVSIMATTFIEVFAWICLKLNEEAAVTLIQEEVVREIEEALIEAFEQCQISI